MQFSIEDLPAPLGPMMARISPFMMSKLMSVSAFTPPNDRLMFSTESRTSLNRRERAAMDGQLAFLSGTACCGARSRIAMSPSIVPLRPSSKVMSTLMCTSFTLL